MSVARYNPDAVDYFTGITIVMMSLITITNAVFGFGVGDLGAWSRLVGVAFGAVSLYGAARTLLGVLD